MKEEKKNNKEKLRKKIKERRIKKNWRIWRRKKKVFKMNDILGYPEITERLN
jgi:hypothetical protein